MNKWLMIWVAGMLMISSCQSKLFTKKTTPEPTDAQVVERYKPSEVEPKKPAKMTSDAIFDDLLAHTDDKDVKRELLAYRSEASIEQKVSLAKGTTPDDIINTAKEFLGTPHRMGGTTKKGIDCSGLLHVTFAKYGLDLPHNSHQISRYGELVADRKDLKKGDLVFFIRTYNTKDLITHAGIYLGDGKFIHASAQKGVIVSDLNDPYYWSPKYIFGKRYF